MCLVMRYSSQEAVEGFRRIAKRNNIYFDITTEDISRAKGIYENNMQIERSKDHTFTIIDLFRFKSLRKITVVASAVHFLVGLEFYIPALIVDKYELGLYISGLAVGLSEFLAYPLCYFMISRCGRKITAIVGYSISLICAIILFFAWNQGSTQNQS